MWGGREIQEINVIESDAPVGGGGAVEEIESAAEADAITEVLMLG